MRFYSFVLKNVFRRRVRSMLTVVGMAVAVGAVVALVGVSSSSVDSFLAIYRTQKIDIVVQQRDAKQRLTSTLSDELEKKIEKIPGVRQVNPGLVDFTSLPQLGSSAVLVQGWEPESPMMKALKIEPGSWIKKTDHHAVLLGEDLARSLEKKVGEKMRLFAADDADDGEYSVVGIVKSSNPYEAENLWVSLQDLQKFMARPHQVTGYTVMVADPNNKKEIQDVVAAINALGPNVEAKPAEESVTSTAEIQFIRATSWITSAIAIIIGAVGMLNTMIMSVSERTREIGILRAIGWRKLRIVRMILVESLVVSVAGGILGTATAVVVTPLLGESSAVKGLINAHIAPPAMVLGIAMALCVGVLGASYPAYRGAQLLPTEALRHE
jgi:putative ABC transport system permease protein